MVLLVLKQLIYYLQKDTNIQLILSAARLQDKQIIYHIKRVLNLKPNHRELLEKRSALKLYKYTIDYQHKNLKKLFI